MFLFEGDVATGDFGEEGFALSLSLRATSPRGLGEAGRVTEAIDQLQVLLEHFTAATRNRSDYSRHACMTCCRFDRFAGS